MIPIQFWYPLWTPNITKQKWHCYSFFLNADNKCYIFWIFVSWLCLTYLLIHWNAFTKLDLSKMPCIIMFGLIVALNLVLSLFIYFRDQRPLLLRMIHKTTMLVYTWRTISAAAVILVSFFGASNWLIDVINLEALAPPGHLYWRHKCGTPCCHL